jgi:hypothetical protein
LMKLSSKTSLVIALWTAQRTLASRFACVRNWNRTKSTNG